MKKLALITLILLFLMLFTTITKMFGGNCFYTRLVANEKHEMNKPACFIIFSSFDNPPKCDCEHVQQSCPEENLSSALFHNAGKIKNINPYEFHNTRETTVGYFLIQ